MADEKKVSLKVKENIKNNKAVRVTIKVIGALAIAGAGFAGGFFMAKKLAGKK